MQQKKLMMLLNLLLVIVLKKEQYINMDSRMITQEDRGKIIKNTLMPQLKRMNKFVKEGSDLTNKEYMDIQNTRKR